MKIGQTVLTPVKLTDCKFELHGKTSMSKLSQISRVKYVFSKELLKTISNTLVLVSCFMVYQFDHSHQPVIFDVNYSIFRILLLVLCVLC